MHYQLEDMSKSWDIIMEKKSQGILSWASGARCFPISIKKVCMSIKTPYKSLLGRSKLLFLLSCAESHQLLVLRNRISYVGIAASRLGVGVMGGTPQINSGI